MDNDVYGHVNNVVYYAFFDTAVGAFLMSRAGLDYRDAPAIGLVVETSCTYFESIAFPDTVHIGVRISKLGSSSVRYGIGIFKNDHPQACAQGYFVHVYVNRATNRPTPIPATVREAMKTLLVANG
jgi:acyl-CoA thioester hydrolase